MKFFLAILFLTLSGCANFTTLESAEVAQNLSDEALCKRARSNLCGGIYGCPMDEHAVTEIKERGLIPDDEWSLIENKKISIGMSECGLNASWGGHPKINTTMTANGTRKQYVYGSGRVKNYVYITGGRISGIQK